MFSGEHFDTSSVAPIKPRNLNTVALPCGRILAFLGEIAILCTKDNGHEGSCGSKALDFIQLSNECGIGKAVQSVVLKSA